MTNLKLFYTILSLFLFQPFITLTVKSDLLYLNNGDVITGEIKKMEFGVLSYDTDDIGTISINWVDVRQIKSAILGATNVS